MSKKTQNIIAVCVDMIMLAVIVAASYFLLTQKFVGWKQYLLQGVIIFAIPTGFFVTYMTFAGHKYDVPPEENEEDEENQA